MFEIKKSFGLFTLLAALTMIGHSGCNKDNSSVQKTDYSMKGKDVLGVTGTVTFSETSSTATTINIVLTNAPSGTHPAILYMNSAVENGAILATLNPIDETGKSTTVVSTMTYNQMIAYDGCIKVQKSSSEPEVILALADIGGNVITTTNKSYALGLIGVFGVSGNALFEQRVNGNTLVTVSLTGTIAGDFFPASINLGSITSVGGGPVVKLLNTVNGTTGKSYTNIRKLDSGFDVTYNNWLVYDGYLNVYQTSISLANVICHGNIGSN